MHRLAAAALLALLAVAAAAPPAAAQEHEHDAASGIVVAHDAPANGRTYVGQQASFAILDLGTDLVPDFHQQNHIRVTLNGVVLWETTADSGHDYDGVATFTVVFPVAGTYTVEALDDAGMVQASFSGTVDPVGDAAATLHLDGPDVLPALTPATFHLELRNATGLVPHSDAIVEVRRGTELLLRTHVHTHDEAVAFTYTFPAPGSYTVRAVGYLAFDGANARTFPTVATARTVDVGEPQQLVPSPVLAPSPPVDLPADDNAVIPGTATGGNFTLLGTYDPYTKVAPGTQQHLALLVMDPATGAPVPHVDFAAELVHVPTGEVVFASHSLHEYDGILELAATTAIPGEYVLTATASRDGWNGHITMPYLVEPPVVAAGLSVPPTPAAGPFTLTASDLPTAAGTPTIVHLALADTLGTPLPHCDADVQLIGPDGIPQLTAKLHTHDGTFAFTTNAASAGDHVLRIAPFPQDPQPVTFTGDLEAPFRVAAGPGFPSIPLPAPAAQGSEAAPVPNVSIPLALALLAGLALARRPLR